MKILVLGVAFVDMKGFPFGTYDAAGTNLGSVTVTHGGVARNVAEDLAMLGAQVEFPLLLDKSPLSDSVRARLEGAGVNLEHAVCVPEKGLGLWLAVFNERGDLAGSISQMPDADALEKMLEDQGEKLMRDCDAVVVEFDVSEAFAGRVCDLADACHKPVYTIVGNMSVILARPDLMARTRCIIMNNIEAGKLFGLDLTDKEPEAVLSAVSERAQALGMGAFVITMGAKGCVYSDPSRGENGTVTAEPCKVVDTTGAGDAFFSAAVQSLTAGESLLNACRKGSHIAALVLSTSESVCPKIR